MYICPECGKFHLITPVECECGYVFKKGYVKCKECNTPISPQEERCPKCRKSVWEMFVFVCPKCKTKVEKGQRVCSKCGELLVREREQVRIKTTTKYVCARCGYELPTINTPCPICNRY